MGFFNPNRPDRTPAIPTTAEVTCLECKAVITLRSDIKFQVKNCRCTKGAFKITINPGHHQVTIVFLYKNGITETITPSLLAQKGDKL